MSALAHVLVARGHKVMGSDRSFDAGAGSLIKGKLEKLGVELYPQNGSGVSKDCSFLVVSSAIEESIPDVAEARRKGVKIIKRAELLSSLFNEKAGVAVGGTSGKTTVTGMTGHILKTLGFAPMVINGGLIIGETEGIGNVVVGDGK